MVRVIPLDKKRRKPAKVLEKYFNIATPDELGRIRSDIFAPSKNLKERKKAFEKHKGTILKLKPLFKQLVIERNKVSQKDGYKNYLEFILKYDGVPKEKFKLFLGSADGIIKEINKNLPWPQNLPSWYWSKFNIPDPLFFVTTKKYSIPDDIYKMVKKKNPKAARFFSRIKIVEPDELYSRARFDEKTKTVKIFISTKKTDIYNALSFVHELGHAFAVFRLFDKDIKLSSKKRYWHEREAFKTVFEFETLFLPQKVRWASRKRILGDFAHAFFEYEIYRSPNQDFDRLYAKALNRAFPLRKQNKNPFYVLEDNLIRSPCYTVINSVVETELFLASKKERKDLY